MLDIKFIRENLEKVKNGVENKGYKVDFEKLLKLDDERRNLIAKNDELRAERNKLTKEDRDKGKKIKEDLQKLEPELKKTEKDFMELLQQVPNIPASDVKVGKNESENEIIKKWGEKTKFNFKPKEYVEIAEKLDLIDTKRAAKVSGTRFGYLKNQAAILEFALIRYVMDILTKEGFVPVVPPVMINEKSMRGMGYFDRGSDEVYKTQDDLYLVGTSEQSIGPMHMDEVLSDLPKRYVAFSTCFRREAGSYGKDTKGILRVHQFDKVEMFSYVEPKDSNKEHEFLLSLEEKIYQGLGIPFEVSKMCTGDLGDPAVRKYDINAWIPSENKYREITSTSDCTDYQARRLNIKFRDKEGKLDFVHTLNGTGVAVGRTIIAILENYQQKDGSIKIPEVLQKYTGFDKIGG